VFYKPEKKIALEVYCFSVTPPFHSFHTTFQLESFPWSSYSSALPGILTSSASVHGSDHPAALCALQTQLVIHSPSTKPDIVTWKLLLSPSFNADTSETVKPLPPLPPGSTCANAMFNTQKTAML
jgi:hypothetical protein